MWVDYLRSGVGGEAGHLDELLATGAVVMCGPVVAELLAGVTGEGRATLWTLLAGLPWAELRRDDWRRAGEVASELRAVGASVALTDIEIAVAAVGANARLWSRDADFARVATVLHELERFSP